MFFLQKAQSWLHSSVSDDKQELEAYQTFKDELENIKRVRGEYISEEGREDYMLQVLYNGKLVPLSLLETLKNSILYNKTLSVEQKAKQSSYLEELYRESLKELESRIITMAINNPNNVYLKQISSSISTLNKLIKRYANLIAIQRSGIKTITDNDELKSLEDSILIRSSEIEQRLAIETMKRY